MKVKVYSLLDRKMRQFGQLLLAANDETLERMVRDVLVGSGSLMEKYPSDFDVFAVGAFDPDDGTLDGHSPVLVACIADVLGGAE